MDYRINNEALVACTIVQVIKHGCKELPKVLGITNLLLQKSQKEYGMLDGGLLTIMMNSLVMLIQGGCVVYKGDVFKLTENGNALSESMKDERSRILTKITNEIPAVMAKYRDIISNELYNGLYIVV